VPDEPQISLLGLGPGDEPRVSDERPRRVTSKRIGVGDIVEVDRKGRRFHAIVEALEQQESGRFELTVRPLDRRVTYRSASVREVVGVWRRVR